MEAGVGGDGESSIWEATDAVLNNFVHYLTFAISVTQIVLNFLKYEQICRFRIISFQKKDHTDLKLLLLVSVSIYNCLVVYIYMLTSTAAMEKH